MGNHVSAVSDDSFDNDVLQAKVPVLVDFWAEWCGPCKQIGPILEEIAPNYDGRLSIVKLNIDENPDTAPKYGIRGIPTLILFKDGNLVDQKVGAISAAQLKSFIDNNI